MKKVNVNRLCTICGRNLTIFQKHAIDEWAKEYERTVISEYKREFEEYFTKNLGISIEHYKIAIAFVLHFGETTRFGSKRLDSVMKDIMETVDMLGKKKSTVKEYLKMLQDDKINLKVEL